MNWCSLNRFGTRWREAAVELNNLIYRNLYLQSCTRHSDDCMS